MQRKFLLVPMLTIICGLALCACSTNGSNKNDASLANQLEKANTDCIIVEKQDVSMVTETEGTVTLNVDLPDYSTLYQSAYSADNPDRFLLEALQSGNYDTCHYEITARVTVENGEQVLHIDEAVQKLLEEQMSQAIDKVMGVE